MLILQTCKVERRPDFELGADYIMFVMQIVAQFYHRKHKDYVYINGE